MSQITSNAYPVVTVSQSGDQFAIVQGGQLKKLTRGGLESFIKTLAPNTFIALTDGPGTYVGQAGKAVVVTAEEDGVEFQNATSGNFLALADSPSSYGGQSGKLAAVNSGETALEFIDNTFEGLEDTPSSFSGNALKLVRVNSSGNALEFTTPAQEQTTGWGQYMDDTYTEGSPLSVTEGVTIDMPNDAGVANEDYLPTGVTSFYNGTVITPDNEGDAYEISIRFKTKSSVNDGAIRVGLDIGGSLGEIFSDSRRLVRGTATENSMAFNFTAFSLDTFLSNGGTVKFEAVTGDQSVYDIVFVIVRTHKAQT